MSTQLDSNFGPGSIILDEQVKQFIEPIQALEDGQSFYRDDIGSSGNPNQYKVDFSGAGNNKNRMLNYKKGQIIVFKAATSNTIINPTLNVVQPGGALLGAKPLVKPGNVALSLNDIKAGQMVAVVYNDEGSGRFEMLGAPGNR